MYRDRLRCKSLLGKVMNAEEAASFIQDGMVVGMSGFTRAGDVKAIPRALAERAKEEPFKITLMTGASTGEDCDSPLTEAGVIARRLPFMSDGMLREAINAGEVMFIDQHLSKTVELFRSRQLPKVDVALLEVLAIEEDGGLVPTTSVGNSASYALFADKILLEINLAQPDALQGVHDIYIPARRPYREPIPIVHPEDRVGVSAIPVDPSKVVGIVITDKPDSEARILPPDGATEAIAAQLIDFLKHEVRKGRLSKQLPPLQAGIGATANAVLEGFLGSDFENLKMYSEVLQDSVFMLLDAGKMSFASCTSITLSAKAHREIMANIGRYRDKLILRPQEISNHPEVVRRLGIVAVNAAIEADIYGNINSTHIMGTHMMNGIGGSGDFSRNSHLSVFVTPSIVKEGQISCIVPMVAHVDHPEHDVDILITEQGLADLRGLAPRERAPLIVEHCAHPSYRDLLKDYYKDALKRGGHTPHILEEALSFYVRYQRTGRMLPTLPESMAQAV